MAGVTQKNSFDIAVADGVSTVFPFTFFAYAEGDFKVYSVLNDVETEITSGITKNLNSSFIGGNVTFDTAPLAAVGTILIRREVALEQNTEFADLTRTKETAIEAALNQIVLQIQQVNTKADLSLKYSETAGATEVIVGTPVADSVLQFEGATGRLKAGATVTEIENAEANAAQTAADVITTNANVVTTNADVVSTAANAAAAQTALESAPFRDTKTLTNADSPYTLVAADNGMFISVDTSGGDVIINKSTIATLGTPFNCRVKKETADSNDVINNCGGTDEYTDGTTTKSITSVGGFDFIAEEDTSPDQWKFASFGASAGDKIVDEFVEGTDFDEGVDNTITLSQDAGSENNVLLIFDRTVVNHGDFNVSGTTLTYTGEATFPVGTKKISAIYGSVLAIGVPSDTSVTEAKLADLAVTYDKTNFRSSVAEAQAGTANQSFMTPLRVAQAITALTPAAITEGTAQDTTSGTDFDFTSIPAGTKRITINLQGVSVSGTDNFLVQIGDAGGIETTGYDSGSSDTANNSTATTGFVIRVGDAGSAISGSMVLSLIDAASNTWVAAHSGARVGAAPSSVHGGGDKSLSAELTQVRLTRTGANTFDAGAVNILIE